MTLLVEQINALLRRVPTWAVYILLAAPAPYLFYMGATGGLGIEPIKALEHELGGIALKLLVAGLTVTPLRRFAGVNLIRFRRALGLSAFFYVVLHLLVWLVLDVQIPAQIWADIIKRPYVTIGFTAFLLLVPLAATSNNWSVRRLGPKWRQLHKLTYVAVILGAVHFIWLVKGFQIEPLVYLAVILGLLALRLRPLRKKQTA
ncbi:Sulfoxide reductase heme-binding subunit YedZ [Roseovarius gaetbuli]|uniref:Protein-methionine-sulfoxide reductase heme-binding subunit MsrQ n=1 Tax=Roseovarius gaetbuli TaxID=1356575 RepID=A0A1X7A0Q5_9RHOB|nr:protein-methionine-sulfoxide reductase heme-binding subunit MsrQ [Roseovarius gaetbuli]SLN66885.1 Sulfoxide reductase heme-binding subunit YedZ [Roseovarius gaetbuli]